MELDWSAASCPPDAHADPSQIDRLQWLPCSVPGTAAAALRAAGRWRAGEEIDLDADDWWFRACFQADAACEGEEVALELGGIATVSEVYLNGVKLLESDSMFLSHKVEIGGLLAGENELAIRCKALAPLLRGSRRPRARWRTRLVNGNLRFYRTMLLGRAPGFASSPAAVGPWRPVRVVRRSGVVADAIDLIPRLEGIGEKASGNLHVHAYLRSLDGCAVKAAVLTLRGHSGTHRSSLALRVDGTAGVHVSGMLTVPRVAQWWPHTHGEPALHDVCIEVQTNERTVVIDAGRTGFRALAAGRALDHEPEINGLDLHVNGVQVFARGAVWTPADPVGLAPEAAHLKEVLQRVRDAGMNMLRIPGTSTYESPAFHDLCDELGLLVWQDFMFANLDYPIADDGFRALVEREARAQLAALAARPSIAILCGNSEIEQQVAMLGLDPALGRGELFGELLPRLASEAQVDAIYLPSAPCGGALPFRPDRGVANYYGVGGYRRPLEDARRAQVRFAAECLAFSNVPDEAGVQAVLPEQPTHVVVHHPRWKAGVPRDVGTGWDFEDVRDHYFKLLFGVDPNELRSVDHDRYLELSRAVSGEVMAEVFGEWRRSASPCGGGLVLWLSDLAPGAGWGVIDHSGAPKPAYHHLRRLLAPVAVWMTDEGLGGVRVHVANDPPVPLSATLRIALYNDGQTRVAQGSKLLTLPAHGGGEYDVEELLGHFLDASYAYRFGPPGHDVVVATLEREELPGSAAILSQAFLFPAGRPLRQRSAEDLGLVGTLQPAGDGWWGLTLRSRCLVYGLRIHVPGFRPQEDALTLEPGCAREVMLQPSGGGLDAGSLPTGAVSALNLRGAARVAAERFEQ